MVIIMLIIRSRAPRRLRRHGRPRSRAGEPSGAAVLHATRARNGATYEYHLVKEDPGSIPRGSLFNFPHIRAPSKQIDRLQSSRLV